MKLQIAIVDDEAAAREYIGSMVSSWAESRGHFARISYFPSAEAFLFEHAQSNYFDILLFDIEMGKMNGVELAEAVRKYDSTVQIVFVTGYTDYISAGYDVAALHYLVKPVSAEKLETVLDRATQKIVQNEIVLTLTTAESTLRIPLQKIRYIDVYKNYVTVYADEEHTVRSTLGDMESALDERFYRVGRGLIVNLGYISKVTKTDIHLSDKTVLPIPKGAYEGLNRAIIGGL